MLLRACAAARPPPPVFWALAWFWQPPRQHGPRWASRGAKRPFSSKPAKPCCSRVLLARAPLRCRRSCAQERRTVSQKLPRAPDCLWLAEDGCGDLLCPHAPHDSEHACGLAQVRGNPQGPPRRNRWRARARDGQSEAMFGWCTDSPVSLALPLFFAVVCCPVAGCAGRPMWLGRRVGGECLLRPRRGACLILRCLALHVNVTGRLQRAVRL